MHQERRNPKDKYNKHVPSTTEEAGTVNPKRPAFVFVRTNFAPRKKVTTEEAFCTHITSLYSLTSYSENDDIEGKGKIGQSTVTFLFSSPSDMNVPKVEC
jgi:hypothetical protein